MVWIKPIVGACDLHNVVMVYIKVVNTIANIIEPTPPTKIITNENILTQYIIKQGLLIFGQKGEVIVQKELQQFHNQRVVEQKKPCDPTYEQHMEILAYLMFIKLKNPEVRIKGQGYAYGRNQKNWLPK